ncbi:PLP-dependent transferase [Brucella abortus]|nr:PLP-dependent transferase [Brucella abortus]
MSKRSPGIETLAVHAGAKPDPATGARATPIYQTTSFVFEDADHAAAPFGLQAFGNIYTRITNPTTAVLEERIAALEGGTAAVATASGHAAQLSPSIRCCSRVITLSPRASFMAVRSISLVSRSNLFDRQVRWADATNPADFAKQIDERTRAIFIESFANPGGIVWISRPLLEIAHRNGLPLIVDNTLASPYLVRPIEHGADIVVHSLTKFIGGHGNSMGGILVDGGTFDWAKSGNYPLLTGTAPGLCRSELHKTFGNISLPLRPVCWGLRGFRPCHFAFQCVPDSHRR